MLRARQLAIAILSSLLPALTLSVEDAAEKDAASGIAAGEEAPEDPRRHWSYQRPIRPPVPATHAPPWTRDPIDALLAEQHEQHQLVQAEPAGKAVLLRRVFLDLIGLSPSPAEIDEYVADSSPDAYERVVDRLLASPRYGERWGRHWMDVWRYSDWYGSGVEVRNSRPHLWRWRDWIVESLNGDKGYDRMVLEMLAADELAPLNHDALRATGFLARQWFRYNRDTWLSDTVEHTSKAFLGITLNCAQCHEHKFDPIEMKDYYGLRAVFETYGLRDDRVPGEPSKLARNQGNIPASFRKSGLVRAYDDDPDRPTYLYVLGNPKQPVSDEPLKPAVPSFLGTPLEVHPVDLPLGAYYPGLQRFVQKEDVAKANSDVAAARQALDAVKKQERTGHGLELATKRHAAAASYRTALMARIAAERAKAASSEGGDLDQLARVASAAERLADVRQLEEQLAKAEGELVRMFKAAKAKDPESEKAVADARNAVTKTRQEIEKAQAALGEESTEYSTLGAVYRPTSSGRRLALARWIVDRENPLAARVAVNHIWMRHFYAPLVPNVFDFGVRSPQPRLVSILDWLAVELVERGWSMKTLHRTLVGSAAYRMSSSANGDAQSNLATDSDNLFLWRMNSRRLEAESVRDSVLHIAGNLDMAMGGPQIDQKSGLTTWRRSIYFRHTHERQMRFLEIFDGAKANGCYRRKESVVPQQALALYNSRLAWEQARLLAKRLSETVKQSEKPAEAFVDTAFRTVLCRPARPQEMAECLRFLDEHVRLLSARSTLNYFPGGRPEEGVHLSTSPLERGRHNLVLVLLNHNDFVTVR